MKMGKHRMAIVGLGGMGSWHARNILEKLPELEVYGAYDIRPEAMESAKAYGTFSLDSANNNLNDEGEENLLEKYVGFEEVGYERIEVNEIITSVLNELSETNRYIFKERFIFNRSQAEIAKALGVSQMTVSRAEKAIVERFKKEMNR